MVSSLISDMQYAVMVNYVNEDGFSINLAIQSQMSFMDAADYAIQAQGYFTYAILNEPTWKSVQIEIGNSHGTTQLIEIKR